MLYDTAIPTLPNFLTKKPWSFGELSVNPWSSSVFRQDTLKESWSNAGDSSSQWNASVAHPPTAVGKLSSWSTMFSDIFRYPIFFYKAYSKIDTCPVSVQFRNRFILRFIWVHHEGHGITFGPKAWCSRYRFVNRWSVDGYSPIPQRKLFTWKGSDTQGEAPWGSWVGL